MYTCVQQQTRNMLRFEKMRKHSQLRAVQDFVNNVPDRVFNYFIFNFRGYVVRFQTRQDGQSSVCEKGVSNDVPTSNKDTRRLGLRLQNIQSYSWRKKGNTARHTRTGKTL